MNLNKLKYFVTAVNLGTISRAAEHLHISQPSLSVVIRELENEFGVPLLERKRTGVVPTDEGKVLMSLGSDLLLRAENARDTMIALGKGRKTVRIGIPPMIGALVLPLIYGDFCEKNEEIKVEISEGGGEDLLERLLSGEVDVAILPSDLPLVVGKRKRPFARLSTELAISDKSNAVLPDGVSAEDLSGLGLALFGDGFFQTERVKRWFREQGCDPNVLLSSDRLATVVGMIASGAAAGFLFRELPLCELGIRFVKLKKPIVTSFSIVHTQHGFGGEAVIRLCEFLESVGKRISAEGEEAV